MIVGCHSPTVSRLSSTIASKDIVFLMALFRVPLVGVASMTMAFPGREEICIHYFSSCV